jgi:hypothetical protein
VTAISLNLQAEIDIEKSQLENYGDLYDTMQFIKTHANIMVLSHENEDEPKRHPFWYAWILGMFHANIRHMGPCSQNPHVQKIEFLSITQYMPT